MTLLSAISLPKSFEATPATTRFLSPMDPSLTIVADVPMHREALGPEALANAAHEQRHVRTLTAAVGVELVEHEEPEALAVADDASVGLLLPRHEELEHHEVGEEDVRGLVCNPLPLVSVFLPRIAGERDRPVPRHLADELVELLHLGVGERVQSGRRRWRACAAPRFSSVRPARG